MQTSYPVAPSLGQPGMLRDARQYESETRINTTGSAIGPGLWVARDTASVGKVGFKLPSGAGDVSGANACGITMYQGIHTSPIGLSNVGRASAQPGEQWPICKRGSLWIFPEVDVLAEDPVYVRITANGGLTPGSLGNVSDSGKCIQVPFIRWDTDGLAGTPAGLRFILLPSS